MTDPMRLLTVGATGSIGRHVVTRAVREGYAVRALVRDPDRARHFPHEVEVIVGDLTRADTLEAAVADIDAIVFTHGTYGGDPGAARAVDYGGVRNVLAALQGRKVRVALMTTIGVTDRKGVHDWKRRGERLLRVSGLPYTIVRPGWFDYNKSDQRRLVLLQGDRRQSGTPRDGAVARDQIAEVLVRSLRSRAALRKTFELVSETGLEPADVEALFAGLDADPVDALDGVHDARNMPLAAEPQPVQMDLKQEGTAL
ncbi:Uncharacterized conserved protein YbjT, contains NAD(P)-binding and DUF2867 domains [Azospirillum oryzae]|uniref:Uncharacterized conserved protein YbjT, contains NAD(P)-binding and DUF2867 domains n=1 Tax=Azospirillum oryzae TaxID=286727 RepID=A0A1X7HNI0_9PROT|nr:SDR family oxidoreductase [Azospirillum oryzae]SMF89971.1 Uncharacterized conserved protein YbjT, contains NAD(P)-binding and DUF2867 domains [Azospirillum oryzae]